MLTVPKYSISIYLPPKVPWYCSGASPTNAQLLKSIANLVIVVEKCQEEFIAYYLTYRVYLGKHQFLCPLQDTR